MKTKNVGPVRSPWLRSRWLRYVAGALLGTLAALILIALVCLPGTAHGQTIGTDIAGYGANSYADVLAGQEDSAGDYDWDNSATVTRLLPDMPHGIAVSQSYVQVRAGDVKGMHEGTTITAAYDPFVFQINGVYGEADGHPRSLPKGAQFAFRTRVLRLTGAVDLGRAGLQPKGLAVGFMIGMPGTTADSHAELGPIPVLKLKERHDLETAVGLHWQGLQRNGLAFGAFVNIQRHIDDADTFNPETFTIDHTTTTSDAIVARFGTRLSLFRLLHEEAGVGPLNQIADQLQLLADVSYQNISVGFEGTRSAAEGHFRVDTLLLPDDFNPISRYFRPYLIAGVSTEGSWGIGFGIYPNVDPGAPSSWTKGFSLNAGYTQRRTLKSIASIFEAEGVGLAISIPL